MSEAVQTQAILVADLRKQIRSTALKSLGRAVGKSVLIGLATFAIVLLIWLAVLTFFGISPYIAKGPLDVWDFLVVDADAAENRAVLAANLEVTLRHSIIGFVVGLGVAILGAILFRVSRAAESALMPVAMLLRSVPLIALAPVIILIFGNGSQASVAVIGGIVVLFPALVTMVFGLKAASPQMLDVVAVYGGNTLTAVRKVALPGALPSLFAAIRISVPGAITGALLTEMLSTGDGVGFSTLQYIPQAKFNDLWAAVVVVTAISLLLYFFVQLIETVVLTRMGMNTDRRN
ncbi:ABC-type nitrate/sulfonate/bicarbonate transport system permease component [Conyzicola lurida]|uniref:ABC-type nitrate/sulfonate/bicarbonate transport system permease component n=1 Tax=Conyzicola lurida TaxID=1172621 RepID=A0A841AKQ3_9MICO|nr:ABC-type nitrate/sulfonate/bicarbonate transport system permease component [Conyzicola lurida]